MNKGGLNMPTDASDANVKKPAELSEFFGNLKIIWAVLSALMVAAYMTGSYVNEYYNRFTAQESKTNQLTNDVNSIKSDVSTLSTRIDKFEPSKGGSPPGAAGNSQATQPRPINAATTAADLSGLPGGNPYTDSTCPVGQYVAGIKASGSPGTTRYCIGCLVSIQAICRDLPK